jgi:hypothetical protein
MYIHINVCIYIYIYIYIGQIEETSEGARHDSALEAEEMNKIGEFILPLLTHKSPPPYTTDMGYIERDDLMFLSCKGLPRAPPQV